MDAVVYPRVGGGNCLTLLLPPLGSGLSPRGRGKLHNTEPLFALKRSIPAWAGETNPVIVLTYSIRVYPRVGGGNADKIQTGLLATGLSPRGRGKLYRATGKSQKARSIPAWAGETYPSTARAGFATVYPRVGGGNH